MPVSVSYSAGICAVCRLVIVTGPHRRHALLDAAVSRTCHTHRSLCVGMLDLRMSCAKTAEPIKMPSAGRTLVRHKEFFQTGPHSAEEGDRTFQRGHESACCNVYLRMRALRLHCSPAQRMRWTSAFATPRGVTRKLG